MGTSSFNIGHFDTSLSPLGSSCAGNVRGRRVKRLRTREDRYPETVKISYIDDTLLLKKLNFHQVCTILPNESFNGLHSTVKFCKTNLACSMDNHIAMAYQGAQLVAI